MAISSPKAIRAGAVVQRRGLLIQVKNKTFRHRAQRSAMRAFAGVSRFHKPIRRLGATSMPEELGMIVTVAEATGAAGVTLRVVEGKPQTKPLGRPEHDASVLKLNDPV